MGPTRMSMFGIHARGAIDQSAIGDRSTIFGFHKAKQLVKIVHSVESTYHIYAFDRRLRMVTTVADQAIQGPGSVQFSQEEARVDSTIERPLAAGICKFHIADGVGTAVDPMFKETSLFD